MHIQYTIALVSLLTPVTSVAAVPETGSHQWRVQYATNEASLHALWGSGASDMYAVGTGGLIMHFDGRNWLKVNSGTTSSIDCIWGTGPRDIFAIAFPDILHYDGENWTAMSKDAPVPFFAMWGTNAKDIYAAGLYHTILHYDGDRWTPMRNPLSDIDPQQKAPCGLYGVWGSSANNVYAVGWIAYAKGNSADRRYDRASFWAPQGVILRYDGKTWSNVANPGEDGGRLIAVWGSGPSNIYAVGDKVLHYDGRYWTSVSTGVRGTFRGIWGTGPKDVYIVGEDDTKTGLLLHYNGRSWTMATTNLGMSPAGAFNALVDVWGSGQSGVYVLQYASILHYGLFSPIVAGASASQPEESVLPNSAAKGEDQRVATSQQASAIGGESARLAPEQVEVMKAAAKLRRYLVNCPTCRGTGVLGLSRQECPDCCGGGRIVHAPPGSPGGEDPIEACKQAYIDLYKTVSECQEHVQSNLQLRHIIGQLNRQAAGALQAASGMRHFDPDRW